MKKFLIFILFPLVLSACGNKVEGNSPSKEQDIETVSWYVPSQGWAKNSKGSLVLLSNNYHIVEGHPIAMSINIVDAGAGHYLAALILNDVSKDVETTGERCPSLDVKYPRVSMMFDGSPLEWISERPVGSAVTLCSDNDASELIDRLVKTHDFSATVRLADGTNLQYKFSPYHSK